MIKAKDEVQKLPKRAINALHFNQVRQFILRHRNRSTVKDVENATAKFLSEQEYYLFHMDTFGMQPQVQATYKRHHKQRESINNFPERKRHIRRNTNDTDLTPVINNLTGRFTPMRKTSLVPSLDPGESFGPTKSQCIDLLSDGLRYHSTLKSPNVASNNHSSNRDAKTKGKRQPMKKNWALEYAAISDDAVRSQGTITVSAIPKSLQHHKGCVRSDPPGNSSGMAAEKNVLSEQRQHQNLFKQGKQLQLHKSLKKERCQIKLSETDQYDHCIERGKYNFTTTSVAYCC